MAAFTRVVAVLVGLANLVAVFGPTEIVLAFRRGDVGWSDLLPPVLAVIIAGLVTSEIALRWLRSELLAETFSDRYGNSVVVVCLGGTLMGFMLAAALTLNRTLVPGPPAVPELMLVSLIPGLVGAGFGLGLRLGEGLILALPLAAILGRMRNGS